MMKPDPEYIKNIINKLDSMNKAAGVDPDPKKESNKYTRSG